MSPFWNQKKLFSLVLCGLVCMFALLVQPVLGNDDGSESSSDNNYFCYHGSNLYQEDTQNCWDYLPDYNGTWYCTKITVCEPHMNKGRECIITRGCATLEQCTNPDTQTIWDGEEVNMDGIHPGGMKMSLSCCKTDPTANDGVAVIDYDTICNSSVRVVAGYSMVLVALAIAIASLL